MEKIFGKISILQKVLALLIENSHQNTTPTNDISRAGGTKNINRGFS